MLDQQAPKGRPRPDEPPRWADRLLEWFVAPHLLEDLQGDLYEIFRKRAGQVGTPQARREYGLAVLRYLTPYFRKRQPTDEPSPSLLNPAMFRNYLTIALRTLAHNKVYSTINVVGLSIGLAAAMLIMLYTKDEISYDRFHANTPNLYRITSREFTPAGGAAGQNASTGLFPGPKFAAGVPEIRAFVRFQSEQKDLKQGTEIRSQSVHRADPDFFRLFTFPLLSGNPETALQQPRSVVLSDETAEKQFGTTEVLGKTLLFREEDRFEPYVVTGVARKAPQNSSIKFDYLMPLRVRAEDMANNENWFSIFLNTFVLLQPGADLRAVEARMNRIYQADAKESIRLVAEKYGQKNRVEYALQPLTDMHLNRVLPADNGLSDSSSPMFSYILSGIALFLLLIACINFVNLTIARSLKRAREIGIRKAVGGGRSQLIIQFLGESFLLCFAAFGFALLLVELVLPTFNALANKALSLSYLFDVRLVAGYGLLFLLTGLLAGFYPALVLSGYNPVQTLYGRFRLAGRNYLQRGLVVIQFALASFLIIATLTIRMQFDYLTQKDLGYDDRQLVVVNKAGLTHPEARLFREELLKNPNIVGAAAKNGGFWGTIARVNNGEKQLSFAYETVDPAYLPLLKIPIVKGRNFSPDIPSDSTGSVLVNETFVREAGWKNPLGQVVDFSFLYGKPARYTVIGVVKDHHYAPLNETIRLQLFIMRPENGYGKELIKIRPGTETASLHHVEMTYKKLFPLNPYSYTFLEESNRKQYESERKWKQIMLFGAVLTIFISCIGLFGLATLSAERRTREIGIRKVLGASVASITALLSTDFLRLVCVSFVFAFPAAWYAMDEWLKNYPYRVGLSVWIFALAAALAMVIALLTVSFQSVRTAMMNPVKSLRRD